MRGTTKELNGIEAEGMEVDDVLAIEDGQIRGTWVNLGEGFEGDYDPADPEDENLLRFDLSIWDSGGGMPDMLMDVEDGSYCTQVNASTDKATLAKLMDYIIRETKDEIISHGKAKRTCEALSWLDGYDLERDNFDNFDPVYDRIPDMEIKAEEVTSHLDYPGFVHKSPWRCFINRDSQRVEFTRDVFLDESHIIIASASFDFDGRLRLVNCTDEVGADVS